MDNDDKIKGLTLRLAIFFGLTTFTLCIAIFYIQSILDNTQTIVDQKDSEISVMKSNQDMQLQQIQENEKEIRMLKEEINDMQSDPNSVPE